MVQPSRGLTVVAALLVLAAICGASFHFGRLYLRQNETSKQAPQMEPSLAQGNAQQASTRAGEPAAVTPSQELSSTPASPTVPPPTTQSPTGVSVEQTSTTIEMPSTGSPSTPPPSGESTQESPAATPPSESPASPTPETPPSAASPEATTTSPAEAAFKTVVVNLVTTSGSPPTPQPSSSSSPPEATWAPEATTTSPMASETSSVSWIVSTPPPSSSSSSVSTKLDEQPPGATNQPSPPPPPVADTVSPQLSSSRLEAAPESWPNLGRPGGIQQDNDTELEQQQEDWNRFRATYNKEYATSEVANFRHSVFLDNRRLVNRFNRDSGSKFKLAINHMADMTSQEINKLIIGQPQRWPEALRTVQVPPPMRSLSAGEEPTADWTFGGRQQPVDQGFCKDSAVFAAVASLEAAQRAAAGAGLAPGAPVVGEKLSERQLLDCMREANLSQVCSGEANMFTVFEFLQQLPRPLASERALEEARQQQQQQQPARPQIGSLCRTTASRGAKLAAYSLVGRDQFGEALANGGPLVVGVDASQPTFHFYSSGLYHEPGCSVDAFSMHVLLEAWQPDWLGLKTSLGSDWGESGRMRMLRDEKLNRCLPQQVGVLPTLAQ